MLPRRICYALTGLVASCYWFFSKRDRLAIENNLKVVVGDGIKEADLGRLSREVFKNFARYLADFFTFSRLNQRYVKKYIKIEGEEFLRKARESGRGAIILSAHVGNWELAGAAVALSGYPLYAVALT